jgi:hypothetical protein
LAKRISAKPDARLTLDGKSSPKLRASRKSDIDDDKLATFFTTLTETCNVVRSAKAAGFTANWAYRKRKRDAGFRNAWAEAVREGYARLELVLLERAIKGTPKLVRTARGSDRVMRDYSTALAVALLRRHAETADSAAYEPGEDELREVRERILEKLERLRERDQARGDGVETKGARDRIGLIEWALLRRGAPSTASGGPPPRAGEDQCRLA